MTQVKIGELNQLVADNTPNIILTTDLTRRQITAHGVLEIADIILIPCRYSTTISMVLNSFAVVSGYIIVYTEVNN